MNVKIKDEVVQIILHKPRAKEETHRTVFKARAGNLDFIIRQIRVFQVSFALYQARYMIFTRLKWVTHKSRQK